MTTSIDRSLLGLAGEFAVAAELCRRNIYAQPTFGTQKRVDLLAFGHDGSLLRLEVKAKQGSVGPHCRGIFGSNIVLVFVDFAGRLVSVRPDFYVLSASEWRTVVENERVRYLDKHPDRRAEITIENVLVLPDELNGQGRAYEGVGVHAADVSTHRDAWHKIEHALEGSGIHRT